MFSLQFQLSTTPGNKEMDGDGEDVKVQTVEALLDDPALNHLGIRTLG